jgi:hypothetical protein
VIYGKSPGWKLTADVSGATPARRYSVGACVFAGTGDVEAAEQLLGNLRQVRPGLEQQGRERVAQSVGRRLLQPHGATTSVYHRAHRAQRPKIRRARCAIQRSPARGMVVAPGTSKARSRGRSRGAARQRRAGRSVAEIASAPGSWKTGWQVDQDQGRRSRLTQASSLTGASRR